MKTTTPPFRILLFAIFLFISFFKIGNPYCQTSAEVSQKDSSFKPSGKFTGQFFGDYYYKVQADSANRGVGQYSGIKKDFTNFDIRRLYLGYNYDISARFSAELLLAYEQNNDGSGNRSFYLKLANIRWKNIYDHADLIFGAQPTPSWSLLSEKVWGYRAVEKTIMDKNKLSGSTDVGLGIQGSFDEEKDFGYDILYGNGTGSKPENDRYKKIYGDLWAKFLEKKIILNVYGDYNVLQASPYPKSVSTIKFFTAYQTKPLTIGIEGFMQRQTNNVADSNISSGSKDTLNVTPFGFSVYVTGEVIENMLNFFVRYDRFSPDLALHYRFEPDNTFDKNIVYPAAYSTSNENFIIAGLDWMPFAAIHIIPNISYTGYANKSNSATGMLKSDNDLVLRVTVFSKF